MRVTTDDRSKRYALFRAGEYVAGGELAAGDHLATGLDVVAEEDENTFLSALPAEAFPTLPESGWLEAGALYQHGGGVVMVRQSHNRTEHDPADVPALFMAHRADVTDVLAWIAGEQVQVGTQRTYGGMTYTCLQAHVTESTWTPDVTPALWQPVVEPMSEWAVGVSYKVGDEVIYEGREYECLQAHTAQPGWTPAAVPSLWRAL
jgi:hypothetical protein